MIAAVDIDSLVLDPSIQPRASLNYSVVEEYSELYRRGTQMPPPVVFLVDGKHVVADGFHRVSGAQSADLKSIEADIRSGTRDDAKWYAAGANISHGLPRTMTDKRRAVQSALQNPISKKLSSREIADHCGVSHTLVDNVRNELATVASSVSPPKRKGKDGKQRGKQKSSRKTEKAKKRQRQTEKARKAKAEKNRPTEDFVLELEQERALTAPDYDHVCTLALQLSRKDQELLIRVLQRAVSEKAA